MGNSAAMNAQNTRRKERTPGQWTFGERLSGSENHTGYWLSDGMGVGSIGKIYPIDDDGEQGRKYAEFIVRACNAHEDLVEALRDCDSYLSELKQMQPEKNFGTEGERIRLVVKAAIAKAEEE